MLDVTSVIRQPSLYLDFLEETLQCVLLVGFGYISLV